MISYPHEPLGLGPYSAYRIAEGEDFEYDYEEYEFLPSISPYALFPIEREPHDVLPPLFEDHLLQLPDALDFEDDGIEWCREESLLLPPLSSPTYTFTSDFAFPSHGTRASSWTAGFDVIGYSKIFTSGLAAKSRKITRRLDWFRRKLRDVLCVLKPSV